MLNSTQLAAAVRSNEQPRQLQAIGQALLGANSNGLAVVPGVGGVLSEQITVYLSDTTPYIIAEAPLGYRLVVDELRTLSGPVSWGGHNPESFGGDHSYLTLNQYPFVGRFECRILRMATEDPPTRVWIRYHYEKIHVTDRLVAAWDFTGPNPLVDKIFGQRLSLIGTGAVGEGGLLAPGGADNGARLVDINPYNPMFLHTYDSFTAAFWLTAIPATGDSRVFYLTNDAQEDDFTNLRVRIRNGPTIEIQAGEELVTGQVPLTAPALVVLSHCDDAHTATLYVDGVKGWSEVSNFNRPFSTEIARFYLTSVVWDEQLGSEGEPTRYGAFYFWKEAMSAADIAALGTGAAPNLPGV